MIENHIIFSLILFDIVPSNTLKQQSDYFLQKSLIIFLNLNIVGGGFHMSCINVSFNVSLLTFEERIVLRQRNECVLNCLDNIVGCVKKFPALLFSELEFHIRSMSK